MSMPIMDYLPFDYTHYLEEIFPIWRHAIDGDMQPLRKLIQTATHLSFWPYMYCPLTPSQEDFHRIRRSLMNELPMTRGFLPLYRQTTTIWQLFEPMIQHLNKRPLTDSTWEMGEMVNVALLYTFCTNIHEFNNREPLTHQEEETPALQFSPHIGNEDFPLWKEYVGRDEKTRTLWHAFKHPLPSNESFDIVVDRRWSEETRRRTPRALPYLRPAPPSGFLTSDETKRLLREYRRHEAPPLQTLWEDCIRDAAELELTFEGFQTPFTPFIPHTTVTWTLDLHGQWEGDKEATRQLYEALFKAHPEQMHTFEQTYYERLWEIEDEMMARIDYAVAKQWGLMVIQD